MAKLWVATGANRIGTMRIERESSEKVDGKVITWPSIAIVWNPAWIVAKRNPNDPKGGKFPDQGPDYVNLDNLPPTTVADFERHPNWGKDWQEKLEAKWEKRDDIERCRVIPSRPVEVTLTADQLAKMKEVYEASGEPLPEFLGGNDSGSFAAQGVVGLGGQMVSTEKSKGGSKK